MDRRLRPDRRRRPDPVPRRAPHPASARRPARCHGRTRARRARHHRPGPRPRGRDRTDGSRGRHLQGQHGDGRPPGHRAARHEMRSRGSPEGAARGYRGSVRGTRGWSRGQAVQRGRRPAPHRRDDVRDRRQHRSPGLDGRRRDRAGAGRRRDGRGRRRAARRFDQRNQPPDRALVGGHATGRRGRHANR